MYYQINIMLLLLIQYLMAWQDLLGGELD